MQQSSSADAPRFRRRMPRSLLIITVLLLLAGSGTFATRWWFRSWQPADDNELLAVYENCPYRNVRPGVRYVGDEKCVLCHEEIAASFRHHPMGRALAPVAPEDPEIRPGKSLEFDKLGYHFAVVWQNGRLLHQVARRNSEGQIIAEIKVPVAYAMGSGTRGRSYVIEKDGHLLQSPISWFTQAGVWDLSPGFAAFFPGERVIEPSCLFCHSNRVTPINNTRNHYETPVFQGYAIGCERCHGPGELHVRERIDNEPLAGDFDDSIVNPRRLEPVLREEVCEQCHLQGERLTERRGRKLFDYRPGLPLHEFEAVFVRSPEMGPSGKAVGHVEQMAQSRCFQASAGKLGCISCHDPHALPGPEQRVRFYQERCQKCHATKPCSKPREIRLKEAPGDNCIACHMQRFASSDIAHTAVTDHRILRQPDRSEHKPTSLRPGELPIVNYFKDRLRPGDPDADRDLGIGLVYLQPVRGPIGKRLAGDALPLLDGAVQRHPDDLPAVESRGWALDLLDRAEEAIKAYEDVLHQTPGRELTLAVAAPLAERLGRLDQALTYRRRLVEINPWISNFRADLAKLLCHRGEADAAISAAEEALRLNPLDAEARKALILACLRTGQRQRAEREKDVLLALRPQEALTLIEWYRQQAR